jgi:adenine phosphoribosyltransferase
VNAGADVATLIAHHLRDVPDFPQPGILFKDIVPLLADGAAFDAVICALTDVAGEYTPIDLVAGVEARGFILAAALTSRLGCGLVPVRKAGKLPPPTIGQTYQLEYGQASIEVPEGGLNDRRVFLVDDVLATGGTLAASVDLIARAGGQVVGAAVLLELAFLHGRDVVTGPEVRALLTV